MFKIVREFLIGLAVINLVVLAVRLVLWLVNAHDTTMVAVGFNGAAVCVLLVGFALYRWGKMLGLFAK